VTVLENEPAPVSVRLEARAGRARPGARDERVHRPDDPAMRTTGTPVGDHGGSIGASFGTRTGEGDPIRHGTRGTPQGPPSARTSAISSTHKQANRNDQRDTFTARRFVSSSLRDASRWRPVTHPARQRVTPDSQTSDPGRSRAPEETLVSRCKYSGRKGNGIGSSQSGKMSRSR
jgi:hypothetical protein